MGETSAVLGPVSGSLETWVGAVVVPVVAVDFVGAVTGVIADPKVW